MKKRNILRRILAVVLVLTMATGLTGTGKRRCIINVAQGSTERKSRIGKAVKSCERADQ